MTDMKKFDFKAGEIKQFDVFKMRGRPGYFYARTQPRVGKQLVEIELAYSEGDKQSKPRNRRLKIDTEIILVARKGGYYP